MEIEAQHELEAGLIFDDRYLIIERVGEGGMGTVYKAKEINLERIVALKVLRSELLGDLEDRARFKTEGRILSQLIHDNVVRFYRYGIFDGKVPYIDMELIEGQNLCSFMQSKGRLPAAEAIAIALQVCDALMATSQVGIVHRDLKPTNVILCGESQKQVKLIDFGLSHVLSSSPVAITQHLTKTGLLIGSVNYMSPEQCLGKKVDSRSDIYALGCMLYEMVSGEQPFVADNPIGLLHKHANEEPNPPVGSLPNGVVTVIANAMRKQPVDRYQTFEELKHDLTLVRQGKGNQVVVRSASTSTGFSKRSSALIFVALLMVMLTLLILGLSALSSWFPKSRNIVMGTVRYLSLKQEREHFKVQQVHLVTKGGEVIRLSGNVSPSPTAEKIPGAGWSCEIDSNNTIIAIAPAPALDDFNAQNAWWLVMECVIGATQEKDIASRMSQTITMDSRKVSPAAVEHNWDGAVPNEPVHLSWQHVDQGQGEGQSALPQSVKIVSSSPTRVEMLLDESVVYKNRTAIERFVVVPNAGWEVTEIDNNIPKSEWDKY